MSGSSTESAPRRRLVLSIFPGIDLLGRAFEETFGNEICLVRGPDPIFGGDIRRFHPPSGVFCGVFGGDPCQSHINLAALNRSLGREPKYPDMTPEFCRVVTEAQPTWFLRENVSQAPDIAVPGYHVQKLRLNNRWLGEDQNRERCFWFGTRDGRQLTVDVAVFESPRFEFAVNGGNGVAGMGMKCDRGGTINPSRTLKIRREQAKQRNWPRMCELQGMPADFLEKAPFTDRGRRSVLANGVPIPMGRAIAVAIRRAMAER